MTGSPTDGEDRTERERAAQEGTQHDSAGTGPIDDALVPREGYFEGQVALVGETRIEGAVRGTIRGSGTLILGPQGRIEGMIECDALVSQGEIVGPIVARGRVELSGGAHFEGDLHSPVARVAEDVVWNGVAHIGSVPAIDES